MAAAQEKKMDGRGIQNARAETSDERFARGTGARLVRTALLDGAPEREAANDDSYAARAQNIARRRAWRAAEDARALSRMQEAVRIFEQVGETLTEAEIDDLRARPPVRPSFPYTMVILAFIKDISDAIATISIFLIPLCFVTTLPISIALFLWTMNKMEGGWWKKKALRGIMGRLGIAVGIKLLPFLQIIPATTVFVLMTHYREEKMVKLANRALEALKTAKMV